MIIVWRIGTFILPEYLIIEIPEKRIDVIRNKVPNTSPIKGELIRRVNKQQKG